MSTAKKLKGNTGSEVTRFKALWRDTLSEPQRDYLRSLFVSQSTQAAIRAELLQKHGINLLYDNQLNAFRDWELEQRQMDLEAERLIEDERRLIEEHPDWTKDQVREELLKSSYLRARATGDFKLGFAAMKQDRGFMTVQMERDKFEVLAAEKMLDEALRSQAEKIATSNLSQADKIAAMRKAAFSDVDALQQSGSVQIPRA